MYYRLQNRTVNHLCTIDFKPNNNGSLRNTSNGSNEQASKHKDHDPQKDTDLVKKWRSQSRLAGRPVGKPNRASWIVGGGIHSYMHAHACIHACRRASGQAGGPYRKDSKSRVGFKSMRGTLDTLACGPVLTHVDIMHR